MSVRVKDRLGHADLESLEMHIRSSMHRVGSVMLEQLLNADGGDYRGKNLHCKDGHVSEFKEYREKKVLSVIRRIGGIIVR